MIFLKESIKQAYILSHRLPNINMNSGALDRKFLWLIFAQLAPVISNVEGFTNYCLHFRRVHDMYNIFARTSVFCVASHYLLLPHLQ